MTAGALRLKEYACPGILVSVSSLELGFKSLCHGTGTFYFQGV
jgi:hypothetical protein